MSAHAHQLQGRRQCICQFTHSHSTVTIPLHINTSEWHILGVSYKYIIGLQIDLLCRPSLALSEQSTPKQLQASLFDSVIESTFPMFYENLSDTLFILSMDLKFIHVSRSCQLATEYTSIDILGRPLQTFIHQTDIMHFTNILHLALESKKGYAVLGRFKKKCYGYTNMEFKCKAYNRNGIMCFILCAREVSISTIPTESILVPTTDTAIKEINFMKISPEGIIMVLKIHLSLT